MRARISIVMGAASVFLASAASAFAQAPTGPAYAGAGPAVDQEVGGGGVAGAGDVVTTGSLPFTGFDIAVALGVGLLLVTVGVTTRRLARTRG